MAKVGVVPAGMCKQILDLPAPGWDALGEKYREVDENERRGLLVGCFFLQTLNAVMSSLDRRGS